MPPLAIQNNATLQSPPTTITATLPSPPSLSSTAHSHNFFYFPPSLEQKIKYKRLMYSKLKETVWGWRWPGEGRKMKINEPTDMAPAPNCYSHIIHLKRGLSKKRVDIDSNSSNSSISNRSSNSNNIRERKNKPNHWPTEKKNERTINIRKTLISYLKCLNLKGKKRH